MYLVFSWHCYYPYGGMNDLDSIHKDEQSARSRAAECQKPDLHGQVAKVTDLGALQVISDW